MKTRTITRPLLVCLLLAAVGCGGTSGSTVAGPVTTDDPIIDIVVNPKTVELRAVEADAVLEEFKDEERRRVAALTCDAWAADGNTDLIMASAPMASETGVGTTGVTFTDTNNQEVGVEEADLIKMQGEHVYAAVGETLRIVRAWPADRFGAVAERSFPGGIRGLLVDGSRLIVLSTPPGAVDAASNAAKMVIEPGYVPPVARVRVTILDVQQPAAPQLVRETTYHGTLRAARRIEDRLVLVLQGQMPAVPLPYDLWRYADQPAECAKRLGSYRQDAEAAIDGWTRADLVPAVVDSAPANAGSADTTRVYRTRGDVTRIVTVVQQPIDTTERPYLAHINGNSGVIYVAPHTVYVSESVMAKALPGSETASEATAVHAMRLAPDAVTYQGTGVVAGHLLNQFAMSEHERILRVATTIGRVMKGESGSQSQVVTFDSADMQRLGGIGGLGRNEQIYAVRFVGPLGYVVTFKKVDPLYVVDLRNPARPQVSGELKVPGYSTYLHPVSDGLLLGLGKDADDQGDFAWYQGLKLSLFDVQDPSQPSERFHEIIGARGSESPALIDHLAFTYDPQRRLLALPLNLVEGAPQSGSTFGEFAYSGLHLYRIDPEAGISLAGRIVMETEAYAYNEIRRSIILADGEQTGVVTLQCDGLSLYTGGDDLHEAGTVTWPGEGCGYMVE